MKKRILSLLFIAIMASSICACGGSEGTSGNNSSETKTEENGFTPNQPTEETETKEEETNISDMTVEEMQKYYDVEKYVGTPTVVSLRFGGSEENGYYFYDYLTNKGIKFDVEISDSDMEKLKLWKEYDCIVCDNNTPDDVFDDFLAYVFTK